MPLTQEIYEVIRSIYVIEVEDFRRRIVRGIAVPTEQNYFIQLMGQNCIPSDYKDNLENLLC